jgi:hypothetical protein
MGLKRLQRLLLRWVHKVHQRYRCCYSGIIYFENYWNGNAFCQITLLDYCYFNGYPLGHALLPTSRESQLSIQPLYHFLHVLMQQLPSAQIKIDPRVAHWTDLRIPKHVFRSYQGDKWAILTSGLLDHTTCLFSMTSDHVVLSYNNMQQRHSQRYLLTLLYNIL